MTFPPRFHVLLLAAAVGLSGCSVTPKPLVHSTQARAQELLEEAARALKEAEAERVAQQEVNRPFLAGSIVPLPKEVQIPEALRRNVRVTAIFSAGPVDLQTALRQVSQATRVPISLTPDAAMPAAAFGPRVGNGPVTPSGNPLGGSGTSVAAMTAGGIYLSSMAQDMPLYTLLDEVARQAQVSWRVAGQGAEFFRTETQVFRLHGLSTVASTAASSGRTGSGSAFASDSKTSYSLEKQDPMAGVRQTVEALLTAGGRLVVSPEDQTLVVTDTPEVLDRVTRYVQAINRAQGRAVRLVVEAIEVVAKDNQDFGIDWNLFYASVASGSATGGAPATLASSQSANLKLSPTAGRFMDSNVVIRALSDVGTVVSKRTFPLLTRSGRPATQTLRSTFNYVDSVQAVTSTGLTTSAPAPTVTQKEETVGTILTLLPRAMDDGQIFLNLSFDVSTNEPLKSFTVGSSANGVTVQQKTINSHSALQEVPMRSGQTVLIGGIDLTTGSHAQRRLAPGAPMVAGGSDQASFQRSHIAILVTAVAEDSF